MKLSVVPDGIFYAVVRRSFGRVDRLTEGLTWLEARKFTRDYRKALREGRPIRVSFGNHEHSYTEKNAGFLERLFARLRRRPRPGAER